MGSPRFTLIALKDIPNRIKDLVDINTAQTVITDDINKMVTENNTLKIIGNKPKCKNMKLDYLTNFSSKFPDYVFIFVIVHHQKIYTYEVTNNRANKLDEIENKISIKNNTKLNFSIHATYVTFNLPYNITHYFDVNYSNMCSFNIAQHFLMTDRLNDYLKSSLYQNLHDSTLNPHLKVDVKCENIVDLDRTTEKTILTSTIHILKNLSNYIKNIYHYDVMYDYIDMYWQIIAKLTDDNFIHLHAFTTNGIHGFEYNMVGGNTKFITVTFSNVQPEPIKYTFD